ncbi:MAG: RHS repeat-associated core domain-containing protein, partial [Proteobacteria bacterium]|nr:RHS repeat-associated core domain-containing protein [Pseudomonadota bacterium]
MRQRYRYDGANSRVVEQTLDETGCGAGSGAVSCERVALYPYPGDFERRGLARGFRGYVPAAGVDPETQYVIAGARTVFRTGGDAGAGFDREQRLVVSVADLIQTTSAAFDVRTGRLLESSTYYPNGARETFLNDDDALVGAEPMGFTGKEADEEVGVVYFGERYLVPRLGRWASPDPLHVHAVGGGEALNSYHYVSGNLLAARDPLGLDGVRDHMPERHVDASGTGANDEVGDLAQAAVDLEEAAVEANMSVTMAGLTGGLPGREGRARARRDERFADAVTEGFLHRAEDGTLSLDVGAYEEALPADRRATFQRQLQQRRVRRERGAQVRIVRDLLLFVFDTAVLMRATRAAMEAARGLPRLSG